MLLPPRLGWNSHAQLISFKSQKKRHQCLAQVPGLTDGWNELKDKFIFEKDNFKTLVLEKHQAKKDEYVTWLDTVKRACHTKDRQAKDQILGFEKHRKQVVRRIHDEGRSPGDEVPGTKV